MRVPVYGFRLFEVTLRDGRRRKEIPFEDCGGEHFGPVAERLMTGLLDKTLLDKPLDDDDLTDGGVVDEEAPPERRRGLRVRSVTRVDERIEFEVYAGTFGDHELAMGLPGEADANLEGRAPSRSFRGVLLLPAAGERGVLAIEDISRQCPVDMLVKQLAKEAKRISDEAAQAALDAGGNPPKVRGQWRLVLQPAVDERQLERVLNNGVIERIELVRHQPTKSRVPHSTEMHLTARILAGDSRRKEVIALVRSWVKAKRAREQDGSTEVVKSDAAITELASILGNKVVELDFDDGAVILEDDNGRQKRVSPHELSEVFVYVFGQRRPPGVTFMARAREAMLMVSRPLGLGLAWDEDDA